MIETAKKAKAASLKLLLTNAEQRNQALQSIADAIRMKKNEIFEKNQIDLKKAKEMNVSAAMIDRLKLSFDRIEAMAKTAEAIASQEEVLGQIVEEHQREDGLWVQKVRSPLGVIAMIFESRPNVVLDCSCLAIKSGNAILLKGGKEALESNRILSHIIRENIKEFIPIDTVQNLESKEEVAALLKLPDWINLVIPRGGPKLIEYVYKNSQIPVIAHFQGICHIYIDKEADLEKAKEIVINAKVQRPGVCNAVETLLVDQDLPKEFLKLLFAELSENGVELRLSKKLLEVFPNAKLAEADDWKTEYLDLILSVRDVAGIDAAIEHIQTYGSHHTEAILTENIDSQKAFLNSIDASCLVVNASTRFNDGGELGLGAEIGISTSKIHAYGPMGAKEMTTSKFVLLGQGQIRK